MDGIGLTFPVTIPIDGTFAFGHDYELKEY